MKRPHQSNLHNVNASEGPGCTARAGPAGTAAKRLRKCRTKLAAPRKALVKPSDRSAGPSKGKGILRLKLELVSESIVSGTSLIISIPDEGPYKETGPATDFILVMRDEPQGGLKMRPVEPQVAAVRLYRPKPRPARASGDVLPASVAFEIPGRRFFRGEAAEPLAAANTASAAPKRGWWPVRV